MNNLLMEVENEVAVVTINRPKSLNALNSETLAELDQCFGEIAERKDIRVVILTGSGTKAFVAASLLASGTLNAHDITILSPALLLMASQIQYMGRLLGVADVPKKYWPLLMLNSILMASIGMLIMRFIV